MLKINPVVHHLVVFLYSLEAGASAGRAAESKPLDAIWMCRLLTLAQVHDSSAELKITQKQVRDVRERDKAAGDILDLRRRAARWRHLGEGTANAVELLSLANHILGPRGYDYDAIERIVLDCSRHDYPSLGIPIPDDKESLLPIFVECDSLWMISYPHGPRADLLRDEKTPSPAELINQIRCNVTSIASRCGVKEPTYEGLTRLPRTRAIAKRNLDLWAKELGVAVGEFFPPQRATRKTK